ncbi:hypothetical protein HDU83_008726 [Entophlyctis luteolus]|nr:hypothetical protein HDU83_008726 [Entophlyctis luteolus]
MAPPIQTGLLGLLVGVAFVDIAVGGLHHVLPFLVQAYGNPALLKSKIVTSVRLDILVFHRQLLAAPVWFFASLGVAYALLLVVSLFNTAADPRHRSTHMLTFLCAVGGIIPVALKYASPALNLRKAGKGKLSPAQEIEALYDIAFVVAVDGLLLLFAFLSNLTADDVLEVQSRPKVEKKGSKQE